MIITIKINDFEALLRSHLLFATESNFKRVLIHHA
jgi:hypothetical protein